MKEQIKQLRKEIDGLHQLILGLQPLNELKHDLNFATTFTVNIPGIITSPANSREIEQAAEKLIFAKAWLGKVLGELGEKTPYKNNGKRKTKEDIEPTADKADEREILYKGLNELGEIKVSWNEMSHIEKVDWLREEIKSIVQKLHNTVHYNEVGVSSGELSLTYLQEARFWLGFELQRIREE